MGSDYDATKWTCKNCGNEFTPKPPNYSCPKCRSNTTYPNNQKIIIEQMKQEKARNEAQKLAHIREEVPKTFQLLCEHLQGYGIEARVVNSKELKARESSPSILSDIYPPIGCVRINRRNIDQIDINLGYMKNTPYFYYKYRIVTDVGDLENELTCIWGKRHWRARPIGGSNRLSELLNTDSELIYKMGRLQLGFGARFDWPKVVPVKEAGCVWIDGFSVCWRGRDMDTCSDFKPGEHVYVEDKLITVSHRRIFPSQDEFEACDAIAEHILSITKN